MGRHPRAEHAAAALVAVDLLRHASSGRSAIGSSIRPGRCSPTSTQGVFGWHRAQRRGRRPRRAQGAARADDRQARQHAARRRSSTIRNCSTSRARTAASPSPTIARPATAPAAAAPRAIPTSTTTTGCGAASSPTSSRPSATARASGDDKAHQGNMPAFGRDGILKPDADLRRWPTTSARCRACRRRTGADLALGKKVFADNCARLPRAGRQGQPRARRAQSDRHDLALRLGQGDHHARRLQRPRRRDAGLGRPPDEPTIKALTVYVHSSAAARSDCACTTRTLSLDQAARGAPALARLVRRGRGPVRAAARATTRRSMRRAARSIRSACTAPSAASNGRCCSSRSASTICCRSCAGIAARARRTRRC